MAFLCRSCIMPYVGRCYLTPWAVASLGFDDVALVIDSAPHVGYGQAGFPRNVEEGYRGPPFGIRDGRRFQNGATPPFPRGRGKRLQKRTSQ